MLSRRTMLSLAAVLPGVSLAGRAQAQPAKADPTLVARAELLTALVETGSLDEAMRRVPGASLTPEMIRELRSIPAAELAAVRAFQTRLDRLRLPQLVLRRETIVRLRPEDLTPALSARCRATPPTHQAPR